MIILGLDYGERRIGASISDELEIAAHPLPNIDRGDALEAVERLVRERGVRKIVLGMPVRMTGEEGAQARKVRGFDKRLRRRIGDVPVEFVDERLTTAQAHQVLSEMGARMRQRRDHVDGIAAQIILERFLSRRRAERESEG